MAIKLRKRHLNNAAKVYEAFKEEMHEWVEGGSIDEERPELLDYIAAAIAQSEHFVIEDAIGSLAEIQEGVPSEHRLLGGPIDGVLTHRLCEAVTEMLRSMQDGPDDDVIGSIEPAHGGDEDEHGTAEA